MRVESYYQHTGFNTKRGITEEHPVFHSQLQSALRIKPSSKSIKLSSYAKCVLNPANVSTGE